MQGGSCSRCSRVQSVAGAGAGVRGPARPSHSAAPALGTARVPATCPPPHTTTLLTMAMPLLVLTLPLAAPLPRAPPITPWAQNIGDPGVQRRVQLCLDGSVGQTAVCSRRTGPRHRAGALSCVHLYLGHVTRDHVTGPSTQTVTHHEEYHS